MTKYLLLSMSLYINIGCAQMPDEKTVGSQLPDHIRSLLVEEMQAITASMEVIFRALIMGDDDQIAAQAQAIHDSFIMAQKMTEADREVLENTLPEEFIKRDKAFHHLSAELAEAARNKDQAKQIKLYQDMQQACLACHQDHALDRFPNLKDITNVE